MRQARFRSLVPAGLALLLLFVLLAVPATRPWGVGLLGLLLFYVLVFLSLRVTSLAGEWRETPVRSKVATLLVGVLFVGFAAWYFGRYDFYPTWDSINYWQSALDFNKSLDASELGALSAMLDSIGSQDYNLLICWVVSPLVRLLPSWVGTFFSVTTFFVVPSALVVALLVCSRVSRLGSGTSRSWFLPTVFACSLLFPTLMRPSFTGLLDAPALLVLLCSIALLVDDGLPASAPRALLGGLCLVLSFLLRRYFVFAAMGVAVGVALRWLATLALAKKDERLVLFKGLLRALGCVLAVVVVSALAFPEFFYRSLFGGQGNAYAAWTIFDSVLERGANVCRYLGWVWVALCALGIVMLFAALVRRRDERSAVARVLVDTLALLVSAVGALLAFWTIQDLSVQHWYIMLGQTEAAIYMSVFAALVTWVRPGAALAVTRLIAVALAALGFANGFGLMGQIPGAEDALGTVLPPVMQRPQIQGDCDEKARLVDDLTSLTGGAETVYFALASPELNSSLPLSTVMPESTTSPFPCAYADADTRDGFNVAFFDAAYVVTSDPVALHLRPENERVVVTLNELVSDPTSFIGSHYRSVGIYSFDKGITATVHELVTPFSADDVLRLEKIFDEMYPDSPELFHDRFEAYLSTLLDGRDVADEEA